jgi:hypothetical protein
VIDNIGPFVIAATVIQNIGGHKQFLAGKAFIGKIGVGISDY